MEPSSRRKTLLYVAVYDPHAPLTGGGTRGLALVGHLAEHVEVDLVYMEGSGHAPDPDLTARFADRLPHVRSKVRVPFSATGYFLFSRTIYDAAVRLLQTHTYDYILCDYGLSAAYGLLLSRRFGVPLIYSSHNLEYKIYLDKARRDKRRLLLVPYVYLVERLAVQRAAILVAITQSDADVYARWRGTDDILVIPQGFDTAVFHPFYDPPRNEPKEILFVGNYNNQFNRDVVAVVRERIVERVCARYPAARFRFVGANPPRDLAHPNFLFTGFVEDYPAQLKAADVMISPLLQGQGAPTKIIEALACGKPIIATPVGARSVERDYASLTICDLEAFPEKIAEALAVNQPVTTTDYDAIKSRYAWQVTVQRLVDRIQSRPA